MKKDTILILDFGSQYTQLIARRVRELKVFSIIESCQVDLKTIKRIKPKGIILSGGPHSVYEKKAPSLDKEIFKLGIPILGICYGMQILVKTLGGGVGESKKREYGRAPMYLDDHQDLFFSMPAKITSWMSHTDKVSSLPKGFKVLAHTGNTQYAAIGDQTRRIYGVQFHPEVVHTDMGIQVISNFLFRICDCFANWQLEDFISEQIEKIKKQAGNKNVICGLSGGVDSSTAAVMIHQAIGRKLKCIFVNNGVLRKNEVKQVIDIFKGHYKIDLRYVDASQAFLKKLKGVVDPEQKRKIIGHEFIHTFEAEAKKIKDVEFLVQGTLYPDVIESIPFFGGPTAKIKSHHNVGGLPSKMKLKLIEPFRELFKDEVRGIAKILKLPEAIVNRHPFPGPGLAVRIIGEIKPSELKILREADAILEKIMKASGLYDATWQAFCVLLPLKTVGVMGDKRTYEHVVAIRAVTSSDGMTADWAKLPHQVLDEISNSIINKVRGINRVVFDISSKPPATIEWE
ncbi:MAG: glutamine-hydrolyzing GMP synthase [Candidatus Omnitrophica bacterium]|nr:glutamine-hydrolyzing GMP synthase [Candidatus Omnitrophota bacterium]MBU2266290.1 glutamine-hydrolyzing GMP synthase [Candidatus Omnitrophota bacterium]MBU2473875.1 glutamine-hydrolyzing GMP synthase [Candidatus Omnitrophota bacterium]